MSHMQRGARRTVTHRCLDENGWQRASASVREFCPVELNLDAGNDYHTYEPFHVGDDEGSMQAAYGPLVRRLTPDILHSLARQAKKQDGSIVVYAVSGIAVGMQEVHRRIETLAERFLFDAYGRIWGFDFETEEYSALLKTRLRTVDGHTYVDISYPPPDDPNKFYSLYVCRVPSVVTQRFQLEITPMSDIS